MAAFGFKPSDWGDDDAGFEVWPENWPAVRVFCEMGTQWRAGMAGATGLDYAALFALLDRRCADADEWESVFADVRVMEIAALESMRAKHEQ